MRTQPTKSILKAAAKQGVNLEEYKTGDHLKISKKNADVDTWLLLGIKRLSTSGDIVLRVRHANGWSGHIMIQDIAKIELVKSKARS